MSQMNQDTNNGSRKAHTLYLTELERQAQEAQDKESASKTPQEMAAPKRSFRMAKDDKTVRLLIGFAGVVAVAFIMLILFSDKGKPRTKKTADASLGRPKTADTAAPTDNGAVVPQGSMQPMREDQQQPGQVNANDIENTKKARVGAAETKSAQADVQARNLGQIPAFPKSADNGDGWAPPPYGQQDSAGTGSAPVQDKSVDGLAKPSLVFTASTEKSSQSGPTGQDVPLLDMGTGSRLAARLASVVTTAVDQPVIAIVEYSYEHDGQLIVPAGSKAVGSVHQADRSGYLQIHFDHLETPDGSSIPIDALATDTNLGPLRGKVTGTGRGKNFAVRAATGIGQMSAMLVGQPNLNGAISEADLMRMQLAENVGRAGDEEINRMTLMEHPIVTLPAGLPIYVVFEKAQSNLAERGTGLQRSFGNAFASPH
jgi:hypothetical protein